MTATTYTDGTTGYLWYLGRPQPTSSVSTTSSSTSSSQAARRIPFGQDAAAQRRMRGA